MAAAAIFAKTMIWKSSDVICVNDHLKSDGGGRRALKLKREGASAWP